MPVPSDTAGLAIAIASGLVKLGGRVDRILAGDAAVRSDLSIGDGPLLRPPDPVEMHERLEKFLQTSAAGLSPAEQKEIANVLAKADPSEHELFEMLRRYVPEAATVEIEDPDGDFAKKLRALGLANDPDVLMLAFSLSAGADLRDQNLAWQLGTAVLDVVTEFAIENQALLLKSDRGRPIIAAVLTRFASEDLDRVGSWRGLLLHVLRSTIEGALEARGSIAGQQHWLEALLDALSNARGTENGDEFVLGLVRGQGYRTLVTSLLDEGSAYLGRSDARAFEKIASAVLASASAHAKDSTGFRDFFEAHWSDLLRASFSAFSAQSGVILQGENPLLQKALVAAVDEFAKAPELDFLSARVFTLAANSAIQAVATDPDLLAGASPWMGEFLGAVGTIAKTDGLAAVVSHQGLERIIGVALQTLAAHPELIVRRPGLPREVVGSVLDALKGAGTPRLDDLAEAAAIGALQAVSRNPALIEVGDGAYSKSIASIADWSADAIRQKKIDRPQAVALLGIASEAIGASPEVFLDARATLALEVIDNLVRAGQDPKVADLMMGSLDEIAHAALSVLAVRGRALLGTGNPSTLGFDTGAIVTLGLLLARDEIGKRVARAQLPELLALFVDAWARGALPTLDRSDPRLQQAFAGLAARLSPT